MKTSCKISPFPEVLEAFKNGRPVIMVDHSDREDEGDIVVASDLISEELIAFMSGEARGLICVSISAKSAAALDFPFQVSNNNSPFQTAFTVSVDHKDVSSTGIEASARAKTIRSILDQASKAQDFVSPGNVFPLVAHPSGVLGRRGQTEGSYDLARLAGYNESGVICEILNPDGTMARGRELESFAERHSLLITSVEEVLRYRISKEILVRLVGSSVQDTNFGQFDTYVFEDDVDGKEHLALIYGDLKTHEDKSILVRVHSECLTGDVFGSRRCDCGAQLKLSMEQIVSEGCGIVLYLRQEGRGIGLANKLKAYELQDQGRDTVQANIELGFEADARDFAVAARMLQHFGIKNVRLMTNNPAKLETLINLGINVEQRVSVLAGHDPYCDFYLDTKRSKMGHLL